MSNLATELRCRVSAPDLRESVDDADEGADDKVVAYWNRMMQRYGSADDYEEAIKWHSIMPENWIL